MDLKQHLNTVKLSTDTFCMMPTLTNLYHLKRAVDDMSDTCEELKIEHPDTWDKPKQLEA